MGGLQSMFMARGVTMAKGQRAKRWVSGIAARRERRYDDTRLWRIVKRWDGG